MITDEVNQETVNNVEDRLLMSLSSLDLKLLSPGRPYTDVPTNFTVLAPASDLGRIDPSSLKKLRQLNFKLAGKIRNDLDLDMTRSIRFVNCCGEKQNLYSSLSAKDPSLMLSVVLPEFIQSYSRGSSNLGLGNIRLELFDKEKRRIINGRAITIVPNERHFEIFQRLYSAWRECVDPNDSIAISKQFETIGINPLIPIYDMLNPIKYNEWMLVDIKTNKWKNHK